MFFKKCVDCFLGVKVDGILKCREKDFKLVFLFSLTGYFGAISSHMALYLFASVST